MTQRLQREGRWKAIEPERDEMMRLATKGRKMSEVDAQLWVYAELDRLYPPLPKSENDTIQTTEKGPLALSSHANDSTDAAIQGLSAIPDAWPELPDNASLAAEIGWVQAQRLRIVEERASGATVVHNVAEALNAGLNIPHNPFRV